MQLSRGLFATQDIHHGTVICGYWGYTIPCTLPEQYIIEKIMFATNPYVIQTNELPFIVIGDPACPASYANSIPYKKLQERTTGTNIDIETKMEKNNN